MGWEVRGGVEEAQTGSHRQPEVLLVFAVNSQREVLVAGLRQSVLFVQNVQDSQQLGFHQVCRGSGSVKDLTTSSPAQRRPHHDVVSHLVSRTAK